MADLPDIRQARSAARILLICPDCGHENAEYAERLSGMRSYACAGEACDFSFELTPARDDNNGALTEAFRRFYAALQAQR